MSGGSYSYIYSTLYTEIEQIIEVWHQDIYAKDFECIAEVAEVLEDGKID